MARGSSLTMITGYVGKVPEAKFLPDKTMVINFSIAVNLAFKDKKSGDKIEKTVWHPMRAYGPRAETLHKYLKKGSLLQTVCSYRNDSYDKDGETKYIHYFNIEKFDFLDKFEKPEGETQTPTEQPQFDDFEDDDIPF